MKKYVEMELEIVDAGELRITLNSSIIIDDSEEGKFYPSVDIW